MSGHGGGDRWRALVRRRPLRRGVVIAAATAVAGTVVACAASLVLTSSGLAAAQVAVPRCSTAGSNAVEVISGSNITGVTVSGISSACAGGTLALTVNVGGGTTGSGSATVPAGGGSVTVTLGTAVAFIAGAEIDTVITGP